MTDTPDNAQHGIDAWGDDPLPVNSPPTEMFMLEIERTTGRWELYEMCFTHDDAVRSGERNRGGKPWRVLTYTLTPNIDDPTEYDATCVLCDGPVTGLGHNPEPLAGYDDGRACDDCNTTKVIPARVAQMGGHA